LEAAVHAALGNRDEARHRLSRVVVHYDETNEGAHPSWVRRATDELRRAGDADPRLPLITALVSTGPLRSEIDRIPADAEDALDVDDI